MVAAHAISKIGQKFQNRSPRESDKNLDIPRISVIYRIIFNFWKKKYRSLKKVMAIPNPGIQPIYTDLNRGFFPEVILSERDLE